MDLVVKSLFSDQFSSELKQISIEDACNFTYDEIKINPDEFFSKSGLKILFDSLQVGICLKEVDAVFFEFITVVSTLEKGKLSDFCLLHTTKEEHLKSFNNKFINVVEKLHHQDQTIIYHPDFFIEPNDAKALISIETINSSQVSRFSSLGKSLNMVKCKKNNEVFVQNASFPYTYGEFRDKAKSFKSNETIDVVFKKMHNIMHTEYALNKSSILCAIPIVGAPLKDYLFHKLNGLGCCFIFIILKENGDQDSIKKHILGLKEICTTISSQVKDITYNFILDAGLLLAKNARENAIRSAISAIMARNMSHNLGSHVFFYVREEITKLADEGIKNDPIISVHKGLAKFLHYVQERQDFVATITSQDEYFMGPLNLKLDVLDELTPDAVDYRHNSEPPSTNFLLKYLVNSENIERKAHRQESISTNKEIEIAIKFGGKTFRSNDEEGAIDFYDINIAAQGGQQSRHAFLIIIENIIRNAAKHGFRKDESNFLEIIINVEEREEGQYTISISDNCGNANIAAQKINEQLNNLKILGNNDVQSIDRENKGLKEIVVCIAWLKKKELSKIFKNEKGICDDLLAIKDVSGNLCYEFTLPKFNIVEPIEISDIETLSSSKNSLEKYAYIFSCEKSVYDDGIKYFPRCVKKIPDTVTEEYWKQLAINRFGSDQDLPVIIFERSSGQKEQDGAQPKKNENNFIFVENEDDLKQKIEHLKGRKYILFKNHLAKNDESIERFYSNETENFGNNTPVVLESISGANFSFNLFQLARNSEKQNELYYRIIEAYFTRIVIIDERLCPVESLSFEDDLSRLTLNNYDAFLEKYIIWEDDYYKGQLVKILTNPHSDSDIKNWWENIEQRHKRQFNRFGFNETRLRYQKEKNIYLYTMDKLGQLFDCTGNPHTSFEVIPHFLSIHISLLDKLSLSDENQAPVDGKHMTESYDTKSRLKYVLEKLKILKHTYVAVHSGRGGLTDRNQNVTFIPFANLQWAFENSKYMLSELFHNQIYFPTD